MVRDFGIRITIVFKGRGTMLWYGCFLLGTSIYLLYELLLVVKGFSISSCINLLCLPRTSMWLEYTSWKPTTSRRSYVSRSNTLKSWVDIVIVLCCLRDEVLYHGVRGKHLYFKGKVMSNWITIHIMRDNQLMTIEL